jgi:hypothetical protein
MKPRILVATLLLGLAIAITAAAGEGLAERALGHVPPALSPPSGPLSR